jgi:putative hydrolase of the HAD superfamily
MEKLLSPLESVIRPQSLRVRQKSIAACQDKLSGGGVFVIAESLWPGIEGIVLDAVGTLIHPEPPVADVYHAAAERQSVLLSASDLKSRFRIVFAEDEARSRLGSMETNEGIELERWRQIVTDVLIDLPDPDRAFRELWHHFGQADAWRCYPDASAALEILGKSGLRIVIGSNFDGRLRAVAAGVPELASLQDALVISSEVGYRKPHEQFYRAACDRLELPLNRVLCVGDDLENDVQGARRAGLRSVHIDRGARATDTLNAFADLAQLVAGLSTLP